MKGHPTRVMVQSSRYSSFDPNHWWETRDGIRTEIIEFQKLLFEGIQPGYTSTTCVIVVMGGVHILVLGLASIYIGRILREVQGRPLFVVRETKRIGPATGTTPS